MLLALLGLGEVIDLAYIKELLIGILTPILITTGLKAKKAKDFIKPKQAKELIFDKIEVRKWILFIGIIYLVIAFLPQSNPAFFNHTIWVLLLFIELAQIFLQKFYHPYRIIWTEEEITLLNNNSKTIKFKDIYEIKYHSWSDTLVLKAGEFNFLQFQLSSLSEEKQELLFKKLADSVNLSKIEISKAIKDKFLNPILIKTTN
jgi:hypothetical protein